MQSNLQTVIHLSCTGKGEHVRSGCGLACTFVCSEVREGWMIFKDVSLFISSASSALLCTIWSWWSKCQNTIRKVVFVVFPAQPESESTRNLLRKAVVIRCRAQFVKPEFQKGGWNEATVQTEVLNRDILHFKFAHTNTLLNPHVCISYLINYTILFPLLDLFIHICLCIDFKENTYE